MSNLGVTQFNSGEITPQLDAAKQLEKYAGGCRRLENMIPDLYGNSTRRPGTELIVAGNGAACYYEFTADPSKIGISTMEDLAKIGNDGGFPLDGDYELLNKLDASGFGVWIPIGDDGINQPTSTPFTGTFDGNFFTINGLVCEQPHGTADYGLFSQIKGNTIVENLVLSNVNFTIADNGICGGIAGQATDDLTSYTTIIRKCKVTGTFTKTGGSIFPRTGGVVGATGKALTQECASEVNIVTIGNEAYFGLCGLVGDMGAGKFEDCYAQGTLSNSTDTGNINLQGPFGADVATIGTAPIYRRCYSAMTNELTVGGTGFVGGFLGRDRVGIVVEYTDNHWDQTLNPTLDDKGATAPLDIVGVDAETTTAMQTQSTFTNWDFGTIWKMPAGGGYPVHQWTELSDIKENCQSV